MHLESPTDRPCPAYNRRDVLDPRKTQCGCGKQVDICIISTASRHGDMTRLRGTASRHRRRRGTRVVVRTIGDFDSRLVHAEVLGHIRHERLCVCFGGDPSEAEPDVLEQRDGDWRQADLG